MKRINENDLAEAICDRQNRIRPTDITQVKEHQKDLLESLSAEWHAGNEMGVVELLKRHQPPDTDDEAA